MAKEKKLAETKKGGVCDLEEELKSLLAPTDDRIFKLILTAPDMQPCLIDISSIIVERPVKKVIVRNNELPTDDTNDKQEQLDLNCETDDGSQINIEVYSVPMKEYAGSDHSNLKNKSIYYCCDLHATQSIKGKDYSRLAKTYQVTFCDFTVFPENKDKFVRKFSLRDEEDGEKLNDAITIVFVELSKLEKLLKKPVEEMTGLEMWSIFLHYADKPEHKDTVDRIAAAKGEIKLALTQLTNVSQDERERAIYLSRKKYRNDMESNMNTAREIGRIEQDAATAKNALSMGFAN